MSTTFSTFFPQVSKPGRYLGCEYHSASPKSDRDLLRCALVFPDLYEIGMSHQGLQILYHLLNASDGVQAERCYCPAPDAETLLRANDIELCSLEQGRPLQSFDLIGITLPHELCYTNILTVLDLAHLPFLAAQRSDENPIIIAGGPGSFNPEPVATLFDAILLGDGEEAIIEIAACVASGKKAGLPRRHIIETLADIEGVYLPHRYQPVYSSDGRLTRIDRHAGAPERVTRRILPSLDHIDHLLRPLVPNARIIHDRLGVEIARGCTRGCRFCQAGITYRPVRERSVEQICTLAEQGIASTGFDEIALLSLSTGDYSCLPEVLPRLMNQFANQRVSLSMPSMRVGTLGPELMEQIKRVRKTGFTLAPEAGSERLRQAINKGISESDLLDTVQNAFSLGWNLIKLYFMIGLPGETMEDIDAIVDLARKTARAANVGGRGRRRVNISVGTFVPKPHTPFQWDEQLSVEESRDRIQHLRKASSGTGINLKYNDPEQSFLEGVFSRGDRRLTPLIITAWQQGARLDSWSEHFNLTRWREAAASCTINLEDYLRLRDTEEILPWQHLDTGVDQAFLLQERDRARQLLYTPDCRYHACQKCGLCDFKTIQPLVRDRRIETPSAKVTTSQTVKPFVKHPGTSHKYLISYSRTGLICFLGHLEFMQVIFRAIRRAGLTPLYSQGFNPSPKISFGPALPVGTESLCEYFIIEHNSPLTDLEQHIARLTEMMPTGVAVINICPHHGKIPQEIVTSYDITVPFDLSDDDIHQVDAVINAETLVIDRYRKGRRTSLDLRSLINCVTVKAPRTITAEIIYNSGKPGCKPLELVAHVLRRDVSSLLASMVRKTSWRPLDQ